MCYSTNAPFPDMYSITFISIILDKMEKEKKHLNIKVSASVYNQLKSDVGSGNVSNFVENLINKELGGTEKRIEQEYREFYANPQNLKEAKQ